MERIVQLDSFGDLGRIVTVSPLLFIVLDELPLPALTLSLGGLCKTCSRPLVSWKPARAYRCGAAVACGCTTAVCRPPWTAEALGAEPLLAGRRLDPIPGRTPGGTAGG